VITKFVASNYKSIKHLELAMSPFMVLVGPNGAGKTNVVKALEIFGEIIARGTIDPVHEQGYEQLIHREKKPARGGMSFSARLVLPHDVVEESIPFRSAPVGRQQSLIAEQTAEPVEVELRLAIGGSVSSGEIAVSEESLTLTAGRDRTEVCVRGGKVEVSGMETPRLGVLVGRSVLGSLRAFRMAGETGLGVAAAVKEVLGEDGEAEGLLRLLNWQRLASPWMRFVRDVLRVTRLRFDSSALRRDSSFDEPQLRLLGPNGDGLALAVARLRGKGVRPHERFGPVLRGLQAVFPRIEDVSTGSPQPGRVILSFKERGISESLGPSSVSDGVLHALALLVALEGRVGGRGVLAIEEPENAIHPWSLRTMIGRAQEATSRQVLLTTHSETLVDSVRDPASLFVVENTGTQGTTVTPALDRSKALASILRESGEKLGDVWLDGTIGGVPETT
jgi:predicted ATPase